MMIMMAYKLELAQILALLLFIGFVQSSSLADGSRAASFNLNQQAFPEYQIQAQAAQEFDNELIDQQLRQRKLQQQKQLEQENSRRYVFAGSMVLDLDQDGHITRTSPQPRRIVRLDHLMESINNNMLQKLVPSTASPIIYRSGRTNRNQVKQPISRQQREEGSMLQRLNSDDDPNSPLDVSAWGLGVAARDQKERGLRENLLAAIKLNGEMLRLGKPKSNMYSSRRSYGNDFVYKRENSRWNNLKGMWGKRADLAPQNSDQQLQSSDEQILDNKSSEVDDSERQINKTM